MSHASAITHSHVRDLRYTKYNNRIFHRERKTRALSDALSFVPYRLYGLRAYLVQSSAVPARALSARASFSPPSPTRPCVPPYPVPHRRRAQQPRRRALPPLPILPLPLPILPLTLPMLKQRGRSGHLGVSLSARRGRPPPSGRPCTGSRHQRPLRPPWVGSG